VFVQFEDNVPDPLNVSPAGYVAPEAEEVPINRQQASAKGKPLHCPRRPEVFVVSRSLFSLENLLLKARADRAVAQGEEKETPGSWNTNITSSRSRGRAKKQRSLTYDFVTARRPIRMGIWMQLGYFSYIATTMRLPK
jgi:hypothetical protein